MATIRKLLLAVALLGAGCPSAPATRATQPPEDVPSLVVVISVDQLRADYLRRFEAGLGQDGFARLARGASYQARYPYAATFTGPGHAAIGTGLPPAENGIVGNGWFERGPEATGHPAMTYCVADPRAHPVVESGGRLTALAGPSCSPVNLSGDALGDRVRERYPAARVIGLSLKDRAAILVAGRKATAAYWLDERSARFESSTYYEEASPAVLAFRTPCLAGGADFARCPHRRWSPRAHLGAALSRMDVFDTAATEAFEVVPRGLRRRGPDDYDVDDLRGLVSTPFGDELLLDFARHVIETERLGARGVPDLLFVSLSSLDLLGHRFGPDSVEVADAVVSLDAQLARFIEFAVDRAGADRVTFALTADHGVQSIPAIARARHPGADVGEVDLGGIAERVEERLLARASAPRATAPHRPVVVFEEPALWIDWARVAELGLRDADPEQVRRVVRDVVARVPGVSGAWTSSELLAPCSPSPTGAAAELAAIARCRAVQLSFRADRSGDVLVTLREGWIWKAERVHGAPAYATTHGQPVDADALVPLLFWGAGIRPGAGPAAGASPLDLATTIGAVLHVQAGRAGARPLPCARSSPGAR
jgi:hypothetical protein